MVVIEKEYMTSIFEYLNLFAINFGSFTDFLWSGCKGNANEMGTSKEVPISMKPLLLIYLPTEVN